MASPKYQPWISEPHREWAKSFIFREGNFSSDGPNCFHVYLAHTDREFLKYYLRHLILNVALGFSALFTNESLQAKRKVILLPENMPKSIHWRKKRGAPRKMVTKWMWLSKVPCWTIFTHLTFISIVFYIFSWLIFLSEVNIYFCLMVMFEYGEWFHPVFEGPIRLPALLPLGHMALACLWCLPKPLKWIWCVPLYTCSIFACSF